MLTVSSMLVTVSTALLPAAQVAGDEGLGGVVDDV